MVILGDGVFQRVAGASFDDTLLLIWILRNSR